MAYVITESCIDETDKSCMEECPVDCIYEGDRMMYIHPDECVDCGRCEPACPVMSIFHEEDVPEKRRAFVAVNAEFFASLGSPGGARKVAAAGVDHDVVASWNRSADIQDVAR